MEKDYSLIHQVMTSSEAAEVYDLSPNTVTQWCNRGKFKVYEARKSGSVWLITNKGMERVYKNLGVRKLKEDEDMKQIGVSKEELFKSWVKELGYNKAILLSCNYPIMKVVAMCEEAAESEVQVFDFLELSSYESSRKEVEAIGGEKIKIGSNKTSLLNPLEITAENPFEPMEQIEDEYDPMDAMEESYNNRPCFMDELERGE